MKHTPGPWKICEEPPNNMWFADQTIYDVAGDRRIADTAGLNSNSKANARLIAAAPELLDALEELLKVANVRVDDPRIEQFDAARHAIAKAKGKDND